MARRYNRWHSRFDQPDPTDSSYDLTDPQSFNRYSYTQGDPVNFVDPSGMKKCEPGERDPRCGGPGWPVDPWVMIYRDLARELRWGGFSGVPDPQNPGRQYDQSRVNAVADACVEKVNLLNQNDQRLRDIILNNKRDIQSNELSLAHAATESSFFENVVGRQGELGLFQIKLATANSLGMGTFTRAQVLDPARNTQLATTHLQDLIDSFGGDVRTALGAYKQGEPGVRNNGLSVASQEYADAILQCERRLQGR